MALVEPSHSAASQHGSDEQMLGAKSQVLHGDEHYKETKRQLAAQFRAPMVVYVHETFRSSSCSSARFRRVGLACRPRLRVAARSVHIVLAKVR